MITVRSGRVQPLLLPRREVADHVHVPLAAIAHGVVLLQLEEVGPVEDGDGAEGPGVAEAAVHAVDP